MKIALFCNALDSIGGAEKVTLLLARELNATIFTTNIDRQKLVAYGFGDILPQIHSIGTVGARPPFRQQKIARLFSRCKVSGYEHIIILGDWSFTGAKMNKNCIWYVHSPSRELWDLYHYTRKHTVPFYQLWLFDLWVMYNRKKMRLYANKISTLVCNSKNTQSRIKRYLNRNATVIHPPIDCSKYSYKKSKGYWLSVNRLIKHKRIELQLQAFAQLPDEKLIIVGSYEKGAPQFESYKKYLESICPPNVEIKHWVSDSELLKLYSECKGFITTAKDEDFGMTVIEAMASGKGVIAPAEGGYLESVIDKKTGILIPDISTSSLVQAIQSFSSFSPKTCQSQAKKFDVSVLVRNIRKQLATQDKN